MVEPHGEGLSVEVNGVLKENENLNVHFLEDLDSYWDDVNERLKLLRRLLRRILSCPELGDFVSVPSGKQLVMLVEELTSLRKYVHVNKAGATVDDTSCQHEIGSKTVDKMLDSLKSILETVLKRKNDTELPSLWQDEHEFQKGIETTVVTTFIRSLRDEYQERLLEKEGEFGGNKSSLLGERS
ncbi:unnamed protein product [Eruca vesicaria subsp. sativa]|uniref:Uncharacterized protein n=1 Tax=Eruca vesicaria subsp. sativa TaxID=29727 RepID=A0ABC8KQ44_ERUVS|nr:unnamed protein product [Eruca vesicaria subsp. sativa]